MKSETRTNYAPSEHDALGRAVQEARDGNPDLLLRLYHQHAYDQIVTAFRFKVQPPMSSEDLAQEVAVRLARPSGNANFVTMSKFRSYCFRVAQNIDKDWHGDENRMRLIHESGVLGNGALRNHEFGQSARGDASMFEIRDALEALSDRQRQAIGSVVSGFKGREGAKQLGMGYPNFREFLFRARQKARELLDGR